MYSTQTLPSRMPVLHNPQIKRHYNMTYLPNHPFGCSSLAKRVSEPRAYLKKGGSIAAIMCDGSHDKRKVEHHNIIDDRYYMRRCVDLAKKAIGCTSPNPMVGCVIVNGGKIVGQGFHPKAGQPHAEVVALRDAGDLAENGTAYVSLEPCNHHGRTPPCTEALIKAKVKNVVVGMVDPNPLVASAGIKKLQESGIQVTVGVEEDICRRLNEFFVHYILTGKPFVTLRYSMSLDGCILNKLGEEAVECGGYYSKLMQEYDGIIFSSSTLGEKCSLPISNEVGANQPVKMVLSKSPNLEPMNKDTGLLDALYLDRLGLCEIVEDCKRRGLCSVLLDLRGDCADFEDIVEEGLRLNLFQKMVVEVLPILGDRGQVFENMNFKSKVKNMTSSVHGGSVILEGYF